MIDNKKKKYKLIELNKDAVLLIRLTDEMKKDSQECRKMAEVPAGPGKDCSGCACNTEMCIGECGCLAKFLQEEFEDEPINT